VVSHLINLDVQLLDERMNVFELADVGVLGRLVLQDRELHELLRDRVGDDAFRRGNRREDDRKQTVGQLVVDLEKESCTFGWGTYKWCHFILQDVKIA